MIALKRALSGVVVIGQKTDGVENSQGNEGACSDRPRPCNKAHGKLFWIESAAADNFADGLPDRAADRVSGLHRVSFLLTVWITMLPACRCTA
jgi:hypothetical protein